MEQSTSNPNLLASAPELTPLETEVLEEYERLAENMKKVRSIRSLGMPSFFLVLLRGEEGLFSSFLICFLWSVLTWHGTLAQLASTLDHLASAPTTEILDGLRELERKTSLVFTLLKASVYSIVLQQEIDWGDQRGRP